MRLTAPRSRHLPWLLALAACSRTFVLPDHQSGSPSDSAPVSAPEDTAVESVPDGPEDAGPLWELCTLALDCGGATIPDEPRTGCSLSVADGRGRTWYSGPAGVELRGRSSSGFPKPQYGVELWDGDGLPVEVDLLGMGAEDDWVLNGAYIDRALIRNKLGYDLFQAFGGAARYAPESAYCTLTLDGTWVGIYFLTEAVDREGCRVDIQASDDGQSFIVEQDDEPGVTASTVSNGSWALAWPPEDTATASQVAGIAAWLEGWMAAVNSEHPGDAETGVARWMDLESAVDFVILQEFMKNNDAYYLSVHLWRDVGGTLHFAPWDLDLTLGQPTYNDNVPPEGWIAYRPAMVTGLLEIPGFREALAARWQALRQDVLAEEAVLERVGRYRAIMGDTVYQNFEVWPIEEIQFGGSYLPPVSSYDEEYARVLDWIPRRLAWMDAHIATY